MKHIALITKKPVYSGLHSTPDGAIAGNGDLCVILGNAPDGARLYLSKCDLWWGAERYDIGGHKPLGYIDIPVPAALYEQYRVRMDMDCAELRCEFGSGEEQIAFTVYVCKTENGVVITQTKGSPIAPVLKVYEGETDGRKGDFTEGDVTGIFRSFDGPECEYETHCFAALGQVSDSVFYAAAATNHETENPRALVAHRITQTDSARIEALRTLHLAAWANFWSKSSFTLSDPELELSWYSSQYLLAVCAGNAAFPPGIFGNFITVEHPSWHSDYHLNYNYQAPFYAACSSNHPELTDCYMAPLEDFYEKGASFAEKFGCRGILYPVGIGPKGLCTELNPDMKYSFERLFLGQKSNAIHPADIPVFRWKATRDTDYARDHAYPYVKACLAFFEDYGKWVKGRFTVPCDAAHEVPIYRTDYTPEKWKRYLNDTNNALTLGLLRLVLEAAIDMAKTLGTDEDKQQEWQHILDNLSPFATCWRHGHRVYRYTAKGQKWNKGNDVGQQHIYPCGCIGLSSPAKDLKLARTTFLMKARTCFDDGNAACSFFPMAARLGAEPALILRKLKELNAKRRLPNLLYKYEGGCLEDCSIPANTLNEMVLQSHQGTLRLFPCWDKNTGVAFRNLRADGAFLVSASMFKGEMDRAVITAEKGGLLCCTLPCKGATVTCRGVSRTLKGRSFRMETLPGDEIVIEPKSAENKKSEA